MTARLRRDPMNFGTLHHQRWIDPMLGAPEALSHEDFELTTRRIADDIMLGADQSLFVGPGLEYAASRPYELGDSIRSMNWKLTARLGRHFVKQYEVLRQIPAFIVVDSSRSMIASSTATPKLQAAAWAAAALGLVFLRRMTPVSITALGSSSRTPRPSLRRSDVWLAIESLRTPAPARQLLADSLDQLGAAAHKTSLIVALSDFEDQPGIDALTRQAQRHDCVAIRVFDPAETGNLRAGFFRAEESETGRMFTGNGRTGWPDKAEQLLRLLRAGVDVINLRCDQPVAPALRRFLQSRGQGARRNA